MQIKEVHGLYDRGHNRDNWLWNQDRLDITVDWDWNDVPRIFEKTWHKDRQNGAFFYTAKYPEGVVSFVHKSDDLSVNDGGALGGEYTLTDGTKELVKGAWSSGAYHWNEFVQYEDRVTEAGIFQAKSAWAAQINLEIAARLLEDTDYLFVKNFWRKDGIFYDIIHKEDLQEYLEKEGRP